MPEIFSAQVLQALAAMPIEELNDLHQTMERQVDQPGSTVTIAGESVGVTPDRVASVKVIHDQKQSTEKESVQPEQLAAKTGPLILDAGDNYDELGWSASITPRVPMVEPHVPETIRTPLKPHQGRLVQLGCAGLAIAGLPGVLNADEQGFGKTPANNRIS